MSLTINDIREFYEKGHYTYKDTENPGVLRRLSADYIFDEDLSVKRNREMVIEHNQKVDEARIRRQQKQGELDCQLKEDVITYIKENYNLTDKQARIVEQRVYCDHHSFMCDYFSYIDTFADFADTIANLEE